MVVLVEDAAALQAHLAGEDVAHGDVGPHDVVVIPGVAHGDVLQVAAGRSPIEDQPFPLVRAGVGVGGEGDGIGHRAYRVQVALDGQVSVVTSPHLHVGLYRQRHPGRHGQVVLEFVGLQATLRRQGGPGRHRAAGDQHPVPRVAGEGVARHPVHVVRLYPHRPTGVVLELGVGDGDDGACAGGVESVVRRVVAVAAEERIADHHPAVGDVQPIVRLVAVLVVLVEDAAALDAHLPGEDVAHGDVGPHDVVVIPGVAHGDVLQETTGRSPIEEQPFPLGVAGVGRRGEGDRLSDDAHGIEVTQDLQFGVALPLDHHAWLNRQGDSGIDNDVAGQDVGAAAGGPGGVGDDVAADVGVQWTGQSHRQE